jgi:hypothetical protein
MSADVRARANYVARPIPFAKLRPGSYFHIHSEPSRDLPPSAVDSRSLYQKPYATDQPPSPGVRDPNAFSIDARTGRQIILSLDDLVIPVARVERRTKRS